MHWRFSEPNSLAAAWRFCKEIRVTGALVRGYYITVSNSMMVRRRDWRFPYRPHYTNSQQYIYITTLGFLVYCLHYDVTFIS